MAKTHVVIIGAGIGGLTLALHLHRLGISCLVLEAAPEIRPLGVGINVLPHASRELTELGLDERLSAISIQTTASVFYNRFGQLIYKEPAGKAAGYQWPQYSIHRGLLQGVLLEAVRERLGSDAIQLDQIVSSVEETADGVLVHAVDEAGNSHDWSASVAIGCDGVHSVVRKQLHPDEGALKYSGLTMWRGTTRTAPFLDGASMVRAGWLQTGKMVIYPIQDFGDGTQLINWVAEVETPQRCERDWLQETATDAFADSFADWHFDWLDVPELIKQADTVLEYPMLDQDPLPWWTAGRITLLGDAAHPMVPRGSNGAGQAILDARALADALAAHDDPRDALAAYEAERLPKTARVVELNRTNPPDAVLREVFERSGDQPFDNIDDVISEVEVVALLDAYRQTTGSSHGELSGRSSESAS